MWILNGQLHRLVTLSWCPMTDHLLVHKGATTARGATVLSVADMPQVYEVNIQCPHNSGSKVLF
jgi:hypothetical protein